MDARGNLLRVENLSIGFQTETSYLRAVDNISFQLPKGKTLALVGESGCGKSLTSFGIMRLLPELGSIENGSIYFHDTDLTKLSDQEFRGYRGHKIAMIFQEPMTALNPVYTVGQQIMEVFKIHRGWNQKRCWNEAVLMLEKVRIPDPQKRMDEYPFQMSGGMRQRVLIAMALACQPDLLIADEPTTALDVTIQSQILTLIKDLQKEFGTSVIFITHDLGVVAEIADEVAVMYAGKIIEKGSVFEIYDRPSHPYTKGLMAAIPSLSGERRQRLSSIEGSVPSIKEMPKGCRFHNRCHQADTLCTSSYPSFETVDGQHVVACHHWKKQVN